MNALRLTSHAAIRMQQRGIPAWYLRLLVEHGETRHDGHGAVIKSVSKSTRQHLRGVLSQHEYAKAERYFGVYAVVSPDDAVITAAHRTHRRFH
ncbi:hypothetical protein [Caenimonas soli]|uniref:hypothetical protein n=1 Tax=Caenimonas soli TaxID=2735555 RepID=UPI0015544D87|nr:hypothetical protein [Caenimonas soli]NPC56675.1 hypothetical protein [Caenimonas soli]